MKQELFRRPSIVSLGILGIIIFAVFLGPCVKEFRPPPAHSPHPSSVEAGTIEKIVDGDTVVDSSGRTIRLLGMDSPELGDAFADKAADYLKKLVLNRSVQIIFGNEREDKYGRILAHLLVKIKENKLLVSEELIRRGLSTVYIIPPNFLFHERMIEAQREAVEKRLGIWSIQVTPEKYYIITRHRFHRPTCRHVNNFTNPKKLTDRIEILKSGRSPCRTCKP